MSKERNILIHNETIKDLKNRIKIAEKAAHEDGIKTCFMCGEADNDMYQLKTNDSLLKDINGAHFCSYGCMDAAYTSIKYKLGARASISKDCEIEIVDNTKEYKEHLTVEDVKSSGGTRCPYCHEYELVTTEAISLEESQLIEMKCENCGNTLEIDIEINVEHAYIDDNIKVEED